MVMSCGTCGIEANVMCSAFDSSMGPMEQVGFVKNSNQFRITHTILLTTSGKGIALISIRVFSDKPEHLKGN